MKTNVPKHVKEQFRLTGNINDPELQILLTSKAREKMSRDIT